MYSSRFAICGETPRTAAGRNGIRMTSRTQSPGFLMELQSDKGRYMSVDILNRNHVRVLGKGTQPLLFAHGFGCDQNMWRYITPAFEDDYRIVLFDYVGSGKSDLGAYDADRYSRLEGYAQDVLDVCRALDLRDVIFVGHSVSSMVGVDRKSV